MLMCAHHTTTPATHIATLALLPTNSPCTHKAYKISLCRRCAHAFYRTPDLNHIENLKRICTAPNGRALPHPAPNPPNGDKTNEPPTIDETTPH